MFRCAASRAQRAEEIIHLLWAKENPGYSPDRTEYSRLEQRVGDQKTKKCVEMFLAGAQWLSQMNLGLLGYHVCRHRYIGMEGGAGGGRVSSFSAKRHYIWINVGLKQASLSLPPSPSKKCSVLMADCHLTEWLRSTPGRHMGTQHVFPADRLLLYVPSRGQRARSCLFFYFCAGNCWQWRRRRQAAAGRIPTWCIMLRQRAEIKTDCCVRICSSCLDILFCPTSSSLAEWFSSL